ncbi:MAG TPA: hypothetical protein PLJ78_02375 [Anaerolineae bacterium]|nr:hypothetical protein [Anaerolineae bacterium]HQK12770.1 hypothetical protein [Anaerolineae bacterium]
MFGASGDLTRRKLGPALHSLACEDLLHPTPHVLGVARSLLSDTEFRERIYTGIADYARLKPEVCRLWAGAAEQYTISIECAKIVSGDVNVHNTRKGGGR